MKVEKVAVIGAGTMGSGIAHTFAQHGYHTYLFDIDINNYNKALSVISSNIDRQIKKGIL